MCFLSFFSFPFLSTFLSSSSPSCCCAQWSFRKIHTKVSHGKPCYACNTTTDIAEKNEVHEKIESPKPSRCNFACHAIQIRLLERAVSAATKKITKTKLQIATKKRERKKGHASSGMGKKTAKKVKVSALKVVATSFRRFHFLCVAFHIKSHAFRILHGCTSSSSPVKRRISDENYD